MQNSWYVQPDSARHACVDSRHFKAIAELNLAGRSRFAALAFLVVSATIFAQDLVTLTGPYWGEDVAQHWVAARLFSEGVDPYAEDALRKGGERYGLIEPSQPSHHFLERHHYPPVGLLLGYPISMVSYRTARIIWLFASALTALACLPLLLLVSGIKWGSEPSWVLVGAFLLFLPVRGALALGQPDIFLFALLLAGLQLDGKGRSWLAGAPLAMAAILKLIPAAWILYFLARRRWKTAGSTVAWTVGLTIATLPFVPPETYLSFLDNQWSFAIASEGWQRYEPTNLSLSAWLFKGFAFLSGGHQLEWAGAISTRLLSAAVLGAIVWRLTTTLAKSLRTDAAGMGLLCAGIALVSPLTWQHHLVVLALPLAAALRESWSSRNEGRFVVTFLVPFLLVGVLDPRFPAFRMLTADLPKMLRDAAWSVLPVMATAGIFWTAWIAWMATGDVDANRE